MSTINHHPRKTHSTQDKIVKYVNEIPGIRYRELLRMTGLSNGVLSYHLRCLDNSGRILVNRVNNRITRYFSYDVSYHESYVIGLLRQETTRKIILYILEKWNMCISRYHDIYEKSSFYYIMAHGKIKSC